MKEKNLCICGCGQEVKPGNKFVHGHNRRGLASFTANGRWSMEYDKCRECGTTEVRHNRDGYCNRCARRLKYSGELKQKRDLLGGKWSKEYDCCQRCGTKDKPHHANGFCGTCLAYKISREKGLPERNFGGWSWYHDSCVKCGTTERKHCANGMCYNCLEETKREKRHDSGLIPCPICGVKTVKLQQHISMKAKKCPNHRKLYNKYNDDIVDEFSTNKTSNDVAKEYGITKKRILDIWHENFTDKEIIDRGEKIRVSKISGKNNYLYGSIPLISNGSYTRFEDKFGRVYVMRSSWEVKYAEYLDDSNVFWEYEEHKFKYYDADGSPHYYFPDFYLPDVDEFVEIKGYMDKRSEYKIKECKKLHGIKIRVLQKNDLRGLGIKL